MKDHGQELSVTVVVEEEAVEEEAEDVEEECVVEEEEGHQEDTKQKCNDCQQERF